MNEAQVGAQDAVGADHVIGVFSNKVVSKVGTGSTTRKAIQQGFWFAVEKPTGEVEIQPLNRNYVPSGPKRLITKDELLNDYGPEPEFYTSKVYPRIREQNKTIARADRHRARGETFSAEMEYGNALRVDDENIRANFGIGLCYLSRGDNEKAKDIFGRLVRLEATFEESHKHLFNEFGINLRKNKMHDQAIEYYERALTISGSDENLHYNLARAFYELGDMAKTREHLNRALELNPDLKEAHKFLKHLPE